MTGEVEIIRYHHSGKNAHKRHARHTPKPAPRKHRKKSAHHPHHVPHMKASGPVQQQAGNRSVHIAGPGGRPVGGAVKGGHP